MIAPTLIKTALEKISGSGIDISGAGEGDLIDAVGSGLDLGMKKHKKRGNKAKKGKGLSAGGMSAGGMSAGGMSAGGMSAGGMSAGGAPGAKPKKKREVSKKVSKRAEIVKKVMKEKGLSMIEASKYVKQHKLY